VINYVEIDGKMCSDAQPVFCSDSAIVNIAIEPLVTDANGPYTGIVGVSKSLSGSATGGSTPYSYAWDLDNDGEYDDASVNNPTHTWDEAGTYTIKLKVTDDLNQTDTDTAIVTIEEPASPEPNLHCTGNFQWTDIDPGETLTGTITLKNNGDIGSKLDWEIDSFPTWGEWSFMPDKGYGLGPEDDNVIIDVTVIVPDEKNQAYSGVIQIVNSDDSSDAEDISITLSTHKTWDFPFFNFIQKFLERFPILEGFFPHIF